MDNKELENILKQQREEYQRFLGVALEEQDSKLKLLAESVGGIQEQLESLREMVARNTEMIAKNAENIEIIKSDIQFIKQELRHKVDRDEFEALERRVMFLERKSI